MTDSRSLRDALVLSDSARAVGREKVGRARRCRALLKIKGEEARRRSSSENDSGRPRRSKVGAQRACNGVR